MGKFLTARNPEDVRKFIQDTAKSAPPNPQFHVGAIVGTLNKHLGGDDNRRLVVAWLFNRDNILSTKMMKPAEIYGLHKWIDAYKDEDNVWKPQPCFSVEAALCLTAAIAWFRAKNDLDRKSFGYDVDAMLEHSVDLGGVIKCIDDDVSKIDKQEKKETT